MKVVVSARFREFVLREKAYLRMHSSAAAERLTRRMREIASLLRRYPEVGSLGVSPVRGVRRVVMDQYVLTYELRDGDIHLLTIRHGRQQDPDLPMDTDEDYEG